MTENKKPSSNIDKHVYDEKTKKLTITFTGGSSYEYENMSKDQYNSFKNSKSLGSHFYNYIKPKHKSKKVEVKRSS